MNVIGIIQTDLNEFSVLFDQGQGGGQSGQGGQGQQNSSGGQSQDQGSQDNDSMFLSFLDEQPSSNEGSSQKGQSSGQGGQQQQNGGPQELTVRIKGIPEGQKANFLQMYQILQDAKDSQSLDQTLTIVNQGDGQDGQGGGYDNREKQSQGHGAGNQN